MKGFIGLAGIVLILCLLGGLWHHIWTLGDDESDYNIVCLDGHQYWRANFAAKGFLGIRLNSDGTPVSCQSK